MVEDEPLEPTAVGLLGTAAVMAGTQRCTHAGKPPRVVIGFCFGAVPSKMGNSIPPIPPQISLAPPCGPHRCTSPYLKVPRPSVGGTHAAVLKYSNARVEGCAKFFLRGAEFLGNHEFLAAGIRYPDRVGVIATVKVGQLWQ